MEDDQFLKKLFTLFNTKFDKDIFTQVHNQVFYRCINSSKEDGARAATDNEDLNKQTNIFNMQLKLICVLFEYVNNLSGCEKVSLDTIKIVNGEGQPVVIKRGDEENYKKVYLCPACYNDMTAQVQAQKQKLEIEQKEPLYFCWNCDQLLTEDKKD